MPTATAPPLTRTAEARLRKPHCRGSFRALDAARRQLGLLAVAHHPVLRVDAGEQLAGDARVFGCHQAHRREHLGRDRADLRLQVK